MNDEIKIVEHQLKETCPKERISAEALPRREAKIDGCFASGHGTVLYFEDTSCSQEAAKTFFL